LKTFITLDNLKRRELPENLQSDDNRYPESLVEHFLALYTKPGDIVLDIFVGFNLPKIDFSMTSPPYMMKEHAENPLTAYTQPGTYHRYLDEMQAVFTQLKPMLKRNAYVVVEVSNLRGNGVTTLAWDVGRALSRVLRFEGEVVIGWRGEDEGEGTYGHGYDHSYCLVFTNNEWRGSGVTRTHTSWHT
jgi:hypothetical protein